MNEEEQQDKSEQAKEKGTFQVEERVLAVREIRNREIRAFPSHWHLLNDLEGKTSVRPFWNSPWGGSDVIRHVARSHIKRTCSLLLTLLHSC